MAGRYTEKTEISYEDYLKLEGLLVLGREANKECDRIVRVVATLVGEDPYDPGHSADAVYNEYSARELLRKSDITVLSPVERASDG